MKKTENQTYHHGDLRNHLIHVALEEVEMKGYEALSLRSLAKLAGVSPAAPYRHFDDRNELLSELVDIGYHMLQESYQNIFIQNIPGAEKVDAACHAYIDFAVKHAQVFRLMFTKPMDKIAVEPEKNIAKDSFLLFEKMVKQASKQLSIKELRALTITIWSGLHGMATLRNSHRQDAWLSIEITDQEMTNIVINKLLSII